MKIPFSKPSITEEEIEAVEKVLNSGWLTVGPRVKEFENSLQEYTKAPFVAAVDSCTAALTLSLVAVSKLVENSGYSRVANIPALTFVATANAAYNAGYEINFVDVDYDGNINAKEISRDNDGFTVTVPVHFAGQVCDLKAINDKSDYVVEDAAHAIGATYDGSHLGASKYSQLACFSFYPTKNMTTVEGGAVATQDSFVYDYITRLSMHGLGSSHINRYQRTSVAKPVVDVLPGFKANMTDIEAAIGLVQLKRLNSFIEKRREVVKIYKEELKNNVAFLMDNGRDHVYHMLVALVAGDNRDKIVTELREQEVMVGIHYSPTIPEHPFYRRFVKSYIGQFPVAEYISNHCFSLPLYYDITEEEIEVVIKKVKELT